MSHIEEIDLTANGILPSMSFVVAITTDNSEDGKKIFYFEALPVAP